MLAAAVAGRRAVRYEKEYVRKDGSRVPIEVFAQPVFDAAGALLHYRSFLTDITGRKQVEQALRQSEERFRSLFESTTEGIALHEIVSDTEGRAVDYRIIDVNPAFETQTGVRAANARGRLASALYGTGEAPYLAEYARVAAGGEPSTFETFFAPMERHFRITVTSPARGRFATVFADITESKRADEARERLAREAAAERERLRTVLETMTEGLVISDADSSVLHMNPEALRIHGVGTVEQARRGLAEWEEFEPYTLDGRPLPLEDSALAKVTRGETFKGYEYEVRNKAAGTAWVGSFGGAPVRDENGKVVLTVLTMQDVTERKRAEEELRLHNEELAERAHLADSLNAINRLLHATLDFGTILQGALDEGVEALGLAAGAIEMREGSQWVVRHQHGLAEADVGRRLAAAEAPIATRVEERGEPLVITDLHAGVVADIGLDHDHALRSLLAIPLVAPGVVVGCLLLCGQDVRTFSDAEVDFGRKLGATVSMALENARLYEDQQRIATTLQENFVHALPEVAGLELGVVAQAAHDPELVGGDFSDVFVIDDTHVVALIGDVAGKGVRAAGLTETVRSTVRALATVDASPAFIMAKANELLLRFDPDEPHVTVFLAVLDPHTGHLSYASAGHPAPIHLGPFTARPLDVIFGPPLGLLRPPLQGSPRDAHP